MEEEEHANKQARNPSLFTHVVICERHTYAEGLADADGSVNADLVHEGHGPDGVAVLCHGLVNVGDGGAVKEHSHSLVAVWAEAPVHVKARHILQQQSPWSRNSKRE